MGVRTGFAPPVRHGTYVTPHHLDYPFRDVHNATTFTINAGGAPGCNTWCQAQPGSLTTGLS